MKKNRYKRKFELAVIASTVITLATVVPAICAMFAIVSLVNKYNPPYEIAIYAVSILIVGSLQVCASNWFVAKGKKIINQILDKEGYDV